MYDSQLRLKNLCFHQALCSQRRRRGERGSVMRRLSLDEQGRVSDPNVEPSSHRRALRGGARGRLHDKCTRKEWCACASDQLPSRWIATVRHARRNVERTIRRVPNVGRRFPRTTTRISYRARVRQTRRELLVLRVPREFRLRRVRPVDRAHLRCPAFPRHRAFPKLPDGNFRSAGRRLVARRVSARRASGCEAVKRRGEERV